MSPSNFSEGWRLVLCPFPLLFSVILSTHWIWSLKLDAETPEFSPSAAEGSVDCSPERGCQHQGGATNNTPLPAGPGSVHQGRCGGVTGYQEQKWEWPGVAGIRNTSDHVLPHQHYACVQNYLVARGPVTGADSEDFCPLFLSQAILQVCKLLGQEAEIGEAERANPSSTSPCFSPAALNQAEAKQEVS